MTNHTPGPWHIGIKQAEQIVYDPKGWAVANATVYHGKEDLPEMKANARLIAAAPELLAALRTLDDLVNEPNGHDDYNKALMAASDNARAAIAKATGHE